MPVTTRIITDGERIEPERERHADSRPRRSSVKTVCSIAARVAGLPEQLPDRTRATRTKEASIASARHAARDGLRQTPPEARR